MFEARHSLTISQAAEKLDVSSSWLRFGERLGSLPLARRAANGYRYYSEFDIALLRSMGIGSRPRRLKRVEEVLAIDA
jgi:DNA-binding transcriptional MerR regulator